MQNEKQKPWKVLKLALESVKLHIKNVLSVHIHSVLPGRAKNFACELCRSTVVCYQAEPRILHVIYLCRSTVVWTGKIRPAVAKELNWIAFHFFRSSFPSLFEVDSQTPQFDSHTAVWIRVNSFLSVYVACHVCCIDVWLYKKFIELTLMGFAPMYSDVIIAGNLYASAASAIFAFPGPVRQSRLSSHGLYCTCSFTVHVVMSIVTNVLVLIMTMPWCIHCYSGLSCS